MKMKLILSFLIMFALSIPFFAQNLQKPKESRIVEVLSVIKRLSDIATQATADEHHINPQTMVDYDKHLVPIQKRVEKEVDSIKDPYELVALARICRAILSPQDAENVSYDRIFNWAYWHCVALLAAKTNPEYSQALELLKGSSYLVGGEKTIFEEIVSAKTKKRSQIKKQG